MHSNPEKFSFSELVIKEQDVYPSEKNNNLLK